MSLFRNLPAIPLTIFFTLAAGIPASPQSARSVAATARVSSAVEPRQTTRLAGHVPAWATPANDLGAVAPSRHLDNMHLVLTRSPQVEAAFEQLLADQQNPSSPRYQQWLTPQQNAEQYGIAPADVAAVTGWLQSQGLSVDNVAASGIFITFSGPVSVVENAFSTTLHNFSHENTSRYAPTTEPAVPVALAGVIQSVAGLSEHVAQINSRSALAETDASAKALASGAQPLYNSGSSGAHYVSPGDFNTIYNINATYNTGINGSGSGNRVVNLIDSRIAPADITGFNSVFGLAVAQPNQIVLPGSTDPGLSADSEGEAALDVQRILGTAPGTSVDLLVFANLGFNNIFSALQYEVNTLNDPIVNMSFGACNAGNSTAESTSFDTYFKTGAAQGISFFVSSGDNAAAGCDGDSTTVPATQVLSTNLICASSYATCVGGTEFAETSSADWASSNSSTKVSAVGYIPEGAWDEPTLVNNGKTTYQASGTGGGVTNFPKPSWQTGTGVPADGVRDVPDVSFTASYHDGYLVCQADIGNDCASGTFKFIVFGTSAASPSMAGVAALLDEKLGKRQGNLNPLFYQLAATPSNSVFHDVTVASSGVSNCSTATPSMCNNSTPSATSLTGGLAGYAVGTGYDLATGLGSLDVTNFLTVAASATTPTTSTTLVLTASANPIATTQTVTFRAALTASGASETPTGTVQFYSNGSALGSAVTLSADAAITPALTFSTPGTYAITAVYSGDGNFAASTSAALSLVVTGSSSFTVTPASSSLALDAGASATDTITIASVNNFAGAVALKCVATTASGTAAGGCSLAPASVTLGSAASSVLTINTTPGTSGVLSVTVTGTSGSTIVTSSAIQVSVALPGFTAASTPASLSVTAGATTGNTEAITLTSVNGFTGIVGLSCSVTPASAAGKPICTLSPVNVTLAAGGTATTVATIVTAATQNAGLRSSLRDGGAMFAVLLCLVPFRRRRAIRSLMALLLVFGGLSAISGCGSGGTLNTAATSAVSTYTVTVTGTGTASGSATASTASTAFTVAVH
jgi:Pro-kumamolisin, activation domain/Bacterial Ig-like domain (group 3)